MREQSRIMEPQEKPDPYADWTKHGDAMKKELAELHAIRDPGKLADRIRKLYKDGVQGTQLKEVQFYVLHEGLPLAARVNEAFTVELLTHVPAALNGGTGAATESPDLPKKQGELLERARCSSPVTSTAKTSSRSSWTTSRRSSTRSRKRRGTSSSNVVMRQCLLEL